MSVGAGKSSVLILMSKLLGPRRILNLYFNNTAALDARARGAMSSHTVNALGNRGNRRSIIKRIKQQAKNGLYTQAEAPDDISLALMKSQKTSALLFMLYPVDPVTEPGQAASSLYLVGGPPVC